MKLDKRIINGKRPLTCFDTEQAKQFVDTKGYFANDMGDFHNFDDRLYGTLNAVHNKSSRPFLSKDFFWGFWIFLTRKICKGKASKKEV